MDAKEFVNRITAMMQSQFGLKPKGQVGSYQCPYHVWYDIVQLPPHYRVLDFSKFTRVDEMTTMDHISCYLIQLGEASVEEAHKVRLNPLSLSGPVFGWFSSLEPNSITRWADLENKFHAYFYNGIGEKKITDLTSMGEKNNELGSEFIQKFREVRSHCYSLNLSDGQLVELAPQGMSPLIREKFDGQEFESLTHLVQSVCL
jgi:hypothetical protein